MARVPNTNTFRLTDVTAVVGGGSLNQSFVLSNDALFDPLYKGAKDRQSNFRNYGPTGGLAYAYASDNGGFYRGIGGDSNWFFITCGTYGVRSFDMNAAGQFFLLNTQGAPGTEYFYDLFVQDQIIFITSGDGVAGKW